MLTRLVRFIYVRRRLLKRLIPIPPADFAQPGRITCTCAWTIGRSARANRDQTPIRVARHWRDDAIPATRLRCWWTSAQILGIIPFWPPVCVGERGKVVAFEPGADNCALLKLSVEVNRFRNVILHPYAVADIDGTVGFGLDDSNGQIADDDPTGHPIQVRSVTLDSFLADEPRIDLIKMDIEGAEGGGLAGHDRPDPEASFGYLRRVHPPRLAANFGDHAGSVPDRLAALDYALFVLPCDGNTSPAAQDKAAIMAHFAGPHAPDHLDLLAWPLHKRSSG